MYYRLNYKVATKEVRLESGAGAAPALIATWTDGGTFRHDDASDVLGNNTATPGLGESHTLFHHVQKFFDETFGRDNELIYDLSKWEIKTDILRSLSIGAGGIALGVAATGADLTATPTPANASLDGLVWTSSDITNVTLIAGTTGNQRKPYGVSTGTSTVAANIGAIAAAGRVVTVA